MARIRLLHIPYVCEDGDVRQVLSAVVTDASVEDMEPLAGLSKWLKDPESLVLMIEGHEHDVGWL